MLYDVYYSGPWESQDQGGQQVYAPHAPQHQVGFTEQVIARYQLGPPEILAYSFPNRQAAFAFCCQQGWRPWPVMADHTDIDTGDVYFRVSPDGIIEKWTVDISDDIRTAQHLALPPHRDGLDMALGEQFAVAKSPSESGAGTIVLCTINALTEGARACGVVASDEPIMPQPNEAVFRAVVAGATLDAMDADPDVEVLLTEPVPDPPAM